ncbi:HNH homing endonuclease [Enterococcus phage 47]|nr:HNH homing endonuclease [Enterococcus phage 47]
MPIEEDLGGFLVKLIKEVKSVDVETGLETVYKSGHAASKALGKDATSIRKACAKNKVYAGHVWSYTGREFEKHTSMQSKKPIQKYLEGDWKPIEGFPNYSVSLKGEVVNNRTGRMLKARINHNGYKSLSLGAGNSFRVHRLVLSTFSPIDGWEELTVNHIDGDKLNNCLDNLEWLTLEDNKKHYYDNNKRILVFDDATGEVLEEVTRMEKASTKYGVPKGVIQELCDLYHEGIYAQENGYGFCRMEDFGLDG